jgi:hypothetical protein
MNADDRLALIIFVVLAVGVCAAGFALADDPEPSRAMCAQARLLRSGFASDRAAEAAARALGISEETIRRAKRCRR